MIVLFTDFGTDGPYVGQMKIVLERDAPGHKVIDLMHDASSRNPRAAAYLLAALVPECPPGTVILGVVDPGVGGPRAALVAQAGDHWLVGPDNGLFELVLRRSDAPVRRWHLNVAETGISASFHGRDVFAPAAAKLAQSLAAGTDPIATIPGHRVQPADTVPRPGADWPDDVAEVIHIDGFGNAITGMRADRIPRDARLALKGAGAGIARARTFCDVPPGTPFWYENAFGLVELAVNGASAAESFGLAVGASVEVVGR